MTHFTPPADDEKIVWLSNVRTHIDDYSVTLDFSTPRVTRCAMRLSANPWGLTNQFVLR